jgi:hypothetical protein
VFKFYLRVEMCVLIFRAEFESGYEDPGRDSVPVEPRLSARDALCCRQVIIVPVAEIWRVLTAADKRRNVRNLQQLINSTGLFGTYSSADICKVRTANRSWFLLTSYTSWHGIC